MTAQAGGPGYAQNAAPPDPRPATGMALLIAALCADRHPSIVQNAEVIDRGYERVEEKLLALGADIGREDD